EWIAYLSAVDGVYGIAQLTLISPEGGTPRLLTEELDRWVRDFQFSRDGRWIYFRFDNHGGQHLARVRVRDGKIERLLGGARTITAFDVDDAGNVVVRASNMNDADELYRVRDGEAERLTDVNGQYFAGLDLGEKQKVSFESKDGTVVEAFIITPPDFEEGRRYPAILDIHGGPVWQFAYGYDFGAQFLAANGYVVVQPNPRGSTGRGQAYVNAIYRTWGITDYEDVIAAIDHAVETGLADPERLAVTGYSYGGYMTNVVITRTDRFKAAASGAGHSLIAANYGHDIYQRWYNWELGPPWEYRERYDALSPLLQADEVETPTIFLGGRLDWNVPILNAELFYQSLKYRGIDTRLVVYPGMHHGDWDPAYDKDYLERVVAWFDRYLQPGVR
ncbi:MAG TPA: S9 family peptidase, partial [Woeseiaceae bacterium]|nr:S9 family peptidase [Woeseiaceae bacterium]